jgi:uncharacterized membrane protein YdjX (TVP38/TMEM64 family)
MKRKHIKYGTYVFTGILIVGLAAAYFISPVFQVHVQEGWRLIKQGDQDAVTRFFKDFGVWGPIFILLFMFIQMITIVLPSWLLMIVAELAYGPVWGTLLSIFGITLVSCIAYWIGHGLGENVLSKLIGKSAERKMSRWIREYGIGAVALFRLSPFLSNDTISFVAGMVNMRFWRFLVGTLAGIAPLAIALAVFSESPDQLKRTLIWIGVGGIALYGVYIWLDRRAVRREKKMAHD